MLLSAMERLGLVVMAGKLLTNNGFWKGSSSKARTFLPGFIKAMGSQALRCTSRTALCRCLTYALSHTVPLQLSHSDKWMGIWILPGFFSEEIQLSKFHHHQ